MSTPAVRDGGVTSRSQPGSWPVLSGPMPPPLTAFAPRHETGADVAAGLSAGETVALVPSNDIVRGLGRLGGAGTTQLAAAAGRALWEARAVDLLVWVTASGRDAIAATYAQALTEAGIASPGPGADDAAARFTSWLSTTTRPWLVVLDDLADPAAMEGLWPEGPAGRVVITSQQPALPHRVPRARLVEVGPFSRREALAYLTTTLQTDPDQRLGALDLATDLAFLPLALRQATAVVAATGMNCLQYRTRLASHMRYYPGADAYLGGVAATWSLAAELADQANPTGLALPSLALVSVMDPNGIPGNVLTSPAACAYLTRSRGSSTVSEAQARGALQNLAGVGLVTIDTTSAARTVRMHPQVQAIVRQHLSPADRDETVQAGADALAQVWPRRDVPAAFEQALRDCSARLHELAGAALWQPECHPVLLRAGRSIDSAGLTSSAVSYWRAMFDVARQALGPGHVQTVLMRDRLAAAYEEAGRLDEAITVYEQALADRERALGPGHPDTLTLCRSLARVYRSAGRAKDSIRLAERALTECEHVLGRGHPDTLSARGELGHAYLAAGRPDEAITVFQHTLAAREQVFGPVHPDTLAIRASLAYAYRSVGDFKEAIPLYERALVDRERAQGAEHPDTLAARASLAATYKAAGRLKDAIPLYRQTLAGRERTHGPSHPSTLTARGNLAAAYLAASKVKDAIPLLERTLADRERVQGPDHPDTLTARGNLASAYHSARKMASAIPLYERTLADCERVLGPGHPDTLASRGNLAHAYHIVGRLTESIVLFERTVADCERVLGPDHPLTETARQNLAAATRS